ncbi:MAG: glycosyltransferase [Bowdeniella nasicola]|nr:glycosyltransferase [Bowdeniella nasicola]
MRICLVSDCYAPRVGGIETQVRSLARHLATLGHEVLVVTATGDGRGVGVHRDIERGVRVWRLVAPIPFGAPVNPWAGRHLAAAIRGADVVHVHHGMISPFASHGASLATRLGRPTVITWHCLLAGVRPIYHRLVPLRSWARRGAVLSAVSAVAARQVDDALGGWGSTRVIPNGADLAPWRAVAQARPRTRSHTGLRVVSAMRLASRKRPEVLARIAAQVRERGGPPVTMDVFGAGPLGPRLARSPGLRVRGAVSQERLRVAYADADVYLSPVIHEAFGLAALEARAAGLVVLARAQSGISEFITDGVDGILAEDDDALIETLDWLRRAPAELRRLLDGARAAPPYDWADVGERVLEAYRLAGVGARA